MVAIGRGIKVVKWAWLILKEKKNKILAYLKEREPYGVKILFISKKIKK